MIKRKPNPQNEKIEQPQSKCNGGSQRTLWMRLRLRATIKDALPMALLDPLANAVFMEGMIALQSLSMLRAWPAGRADRCKHVWPANSTVPIHHLNLLSCGFLHTVINPFQQFFIVKGSVACKFERNRLAITHTSNVLMLTGGAAGITLWGVGERGGGGTLSPTGVTSNARWRICS